MSLKQVVIFFASAPLLTGFYSASAQARLMFASPELPELQFLPADVRGKYLVTPGGYIYEYCITQDGDVVQKDGSTLYSDGTVMPPGPCPYPFIHVTPYGIVVDQSPKR